MENSSYIVTRLHNILYKNYRKDGIDLSDREIKMMFTLCQPRLLRSARSIICDILNGNCRVFTVIIPNGDYYYKTLVSTPDGYLLLDRSAHIINEKTFVKYFDHIQNLHEVSVKQLIANWHKY